MRRVVLIVLSLLLCCSLIACGNSSSKKGDIPPEGTPSGEEETSESESPENVWIGEPPPVEIQIKAEESEEYKSTADIVSDFNSIEELSVYCDTTSSNFPDYGRVFSIANVEEQEQIMQYLLDADLSGFTDTERAGVGGVAVRMRIRTGTESYVMTILSHVEVTNANSEEGAYIDAQYLEIYYDDFRYQFMKGPPDAFSFIEIHEATNKVKGNYKDPDYSGIVTRTSYNAPYPIIKANSAYVKTVLDGTLSDSGSEAGDAAADYDVKFTMGQTEYQINSATGSFFRNMDGILLYGQLESNWLMGVRIRLGVPMPKTTENE